MLRGRGYLAFFVGICLTAWTCYFVMEEQQKLQVRASFQHDAEKVAREMQSRLQIYFDTLHAMRGVYAVNDRIDRQHFHRFVTELKIERRYPGFQALQFVRVVPEAELPRFVAHVKNDTSVDAQGYANFHVHPASVRPLHYIVEYTEPLKGNENAFGLDLSALTPHLKALELGRDSGEIVATERITLVQDASGDSLDAVLCLLQAAWAQQRHAEGDALYGLPPGLGSHVQWDRRLDAKLAQALMSIQAIKGVEVGDGFETTRRPGSAAHDELFAASDGITRASDKAGGTEGGMSTGTVLRVRAGMKPIATVPHSLRTIDVTTGEAATAHHQRSDVCAVPAAGVVAEAMVAFVLAEVVLEKFGGDALAETRRNLESYLAAIPEGLHTAPGSDAALA